MKLTINIYDLSLILVRKCRSYYLPLAVHRATRMRSFASFQIAMAMSLAMCRLQMRGRGSLVKCLQKVDKFLHRCIGTNVVAAQSEESRKDETG